MNITTLNNEQLTMSSREIAKLTKSRHDSVKRSMERMEGVITITPMVEPTEGGGKPTTVYHVNKRDSYVVVAQLSPEFTAALVDRWQELESYQTPQLPQSFAEALQLAADQAKQIEQQTQAIEHHQKHIAGLENLFHSGGTIPQFVKQLNGVNSNLVNAWLYENTNWLYDSNAGKVYQSGRPKPHEWRCASYARDKYLTERTINIEKQGLESITKYKVELLAEGKKWLYRKYIKGLLPMKANFNGKYTHEKDLT